MIIKNAKIITFEEPNRIITGGSLKINSSGKIEKIYPSGENPVPDNGEEVLDANGQYLMPAGICAHTHFYGAYSRGMYIPGEAPDAFPAILEKLWWKLDKALDADANYYSAMVCLLNAIRNGTTTLIDHHASPNAIPGSLDILAKAVMQSGIRASLCYELTDRDGQERSDQGIEENVRFIREAQSGKFGQQISALFGLHASLTLSDETLQKAKNACPQVVGFHIHAAEHIVDEYDSVRKGGLRVVERLDQFGILGPKTIVAHGVHIDAHEISLLARRETWLSHQPRSNMNNAVGLPEIESMLNMGVKVCLGNDGFSNSMWEEWKAAYLSHKLLHRDPRRMPADKIYQMAVINNRNLVKTIFGGLETGIIKNGAAADIILVDYKPYTDLTIENFPWQLIFGFEDGMVTTTIVNGKMLMKDRRITILDEDAVIREAGKISAAVWKRYHDSF
ncbi:MAG: putative aminohydrolase SsnA [Anaerolineae bacterium]|nr:putative aminohydrolase SsnA [Anaerolineae bacterium]